MEILSFNCTLRGIEGFFKEKVNRQEHFQESIKSKVWAHNSGNLPHANVQASDASLRERSPRPGNPDCARRR